MPVRKKRLHKIIGNMHRKSPKKVKKAKLMQRRIKAERHILIFVAILRDHAPNLRNRRYLAWTRSFGWLQAKPGEHILCIGAVITLILVIFKNAFETHSVHGLRDHAHFSDIQKCSRNRFCAQAAWARSKSQMLSIFSVNTLMWLTSGGSKPS